MSLWPWQGGLRTQGTCFGLSFAPWRRVVGRCRPPLGRQRLVSPRYIGVDVSGPRCIAAPRVNNRQRSVFVRFGGLFSWRFFVRGDLHGRAYSKRQGQCRRLRGDGWVMMMMMAAGRTLEEVLADGCLHLGLYGPLGVQGEI